MSDPSRTPRLRSLQSRLQVAFIGFGLLAVLMVGWQAHLVATSALREATFNRLTAIRETKRRQIEAYFRDLRNHVLALSSDDSTVDAVLQFREAWAQIPPTAPESEDAEALRRYYREDVGPRVSTTISEDRLLAEWFPDHPSQVALQSRFLARNPHPLGMKDLLVVAPDFGRYGELHTRLHPTFHRYMTSFGFYDIFLIDARTGRILYTVFKETDFGASLTQGPFAQTALARAYQRAMEAQQPDEVVFEDYSPYIASHYAPAAFVATPIWRAGAKVGVLAIQISVSEVNRMVTSDRSWRETGMGSTGQTYLVGADQMLRSDVRFEIEQPEVYFQQLFGAGIAPKLVEEIRHNRTGILLLPAGGDAAELIRKNRPVTEIASDFRNIQVLRSFAPLNIPQLRWFVITEMEAAEAFAPVNELQARILGIGTLVALVLLAVGALLGRNLTRPILALAAGARRLGTGDFSTRLTIARDDEIGDLAQSFNRMAESLQQTTVSKSELDLANQELRRQQRELEDLAARLMRAQEDERARLARELHDDLTQRIAAIAIEAGKLEKSALAINLSAASKLAELRQSLVHLSGDVHRLSRSLHPSMLEELGLTAALEHEFRASFERGGPPVHFEADEAADQVPPAVQLGVFRVVQEALQNASRHAQASEVRVAIGVRHGNLSLEIEDDGKGFSQSDPAWKPGLGLASMRERVHLLGGRFQLRSSPGEGTHITIAIPTGEVDEEGNRRLSG